MFYRLIAVAVLVWAFQVRVVSAQPPKPQDVKVTLLSVTAERYDDVMAPITFDLDSGPLWDKKLVIPPGQIAVGVWPHFLADFGDEFGASVWVGPERFIVRAGDGKVLNPIGTFSHYSELRRPEWWTIYRPAGYDKKNPRPLTTSFVYLVPEGEKTLQASMEGQTASVTVPQAVTKLQLSKTMTFRVISARFVDSLPLHSGGEKPYTNPSGKLLLVKCTWKGTAANQTREGGFDLAATWLNVRAPDGRRFPAVGKLVDGKLWGSSKAGGCGLSGEGQIGTSFENTYVFTVPADVRAFELTVLGQVMGRGVATGGATTRATRPE